MRLAVRRRRIQPAKRLDRIGPPGEFLRIHFSPLVGIEEPDDVHQARGSPFILDVRAGHLQKAVAVEIGNFVEPHKRLRAGRVESIDLLSVDQDFLKANPGLGVRVEEADGHEVLARGPHFELKRGGRSRFRAGPAVQPLANAGSKPSGTAPAVLQNPVAGIVEIVDISRCTLSDPCRVGRRQANPEQLVAIAYRACRPALRARRPGSRIFGPTSGWIPSRGGTSRMPGSTR